MGTFKQVDLRRAGEVQHVPQRHVAVRQGSAEHSAAPPDDVSSNLVTGRLL